MDAYTFGMLFGALSVGILCGIIPFKLGKKHNKEGWGLAGLITSIIGGLSLGIILALPLAGVFSAIILVSIDN
jgi:hypothetical protein|tara:strand:+ start:229 stop:447 length:219 start_codon:yes stop_codon:yes gene_type:complete